MKTSFLLAALITCVFTSDFSNAGLCDDELSYNQLPADYELLSNSQKEQILWNNIQKSSYTEAQLAEHNSNPGVLDMVKIFNPYYLVKTFTNESDVLPFNVFGRRKKLVHTHGSVAKVKLVLNAGNFSGLLQAGQAVSGLARISLATHGEVFIPGMALKFFVDEQPSQNIVVMHSTGGQGNDQNVFTNDFDNDTSNSPEPSDAAKKLLKKAFQKAVKIVTKGKNSSADFLSVEHLASVRTDGQSVAKENLKFPKLLIFKPTEQSQGFYADQLKSNPSGDFRTHLGKIPSGAVLYDVYGDDVKIGILELDQSQFTPSNYGDEVLFFKHKMF